LHALKILLECPLLGCRCCFCRRALLLFFLKPLLELLRLFCYLLPMQPCGLGNLRSLLAELVFNFKSCFLSGGEACSFRLGGTLCLKLCFLK